MKRILVPALLAISAASALAQPRPYFYLWAPPPEGGANPVSGQASVMVVVNVYPQLASEPVPTPEEVAASVSSAVASQVSSGMTEADHIDIVLLNYGAPVLTVADPLGRHELDQYRYERSFIDPQFDELDNPEPLWDLPPAATNGFRFMHPWLNHGIDNMQSWMQRFLDAYDGPAPARFDFDNEYTATTFDYINNVRILQAMAQDPRWVGTVVPGSGSKTMKQLYEGDYPGDPNCAIARYHWDNDQPLWVQLAPGQFQAPSQSYLTRPYFMWYSGVCQAAVDAAMQQSAYSLIRQKWPNCEVSNYSDFNADGKEDTFGWYDGTVYHDPDFAHEAITYHGVRGYVNMFPSGSQNIWGDLKDYGADPVNPPYSLFNTLPAHASGTFSAPVLYTVDPNFLHTWSEPQEPRINPYLPSHPPGEINGMPRDSKLTLPDASLISQRRTLESVLNSDTLPSAGTKVSPWIMAIGQYIPNDPNPTADSVSHNEMVSRLAMLRAKRVTDVIVFNWGYNIGLNNWIEMNSAIDQVYRPQLDSFKVLMGLAPNPDTRSPDALRDTLRNSPGGEQTIIVPASSTLDDGSGVIAFEGDFSGLSYKQGTVVHRLEGLVLNFELESTLPGGEAEGDTQAVYGRVYQWNYNAPGGGDWDLVRPMYSSADPWSFAAYDYEDPGRGVCTACRFGVFPRQAYQPDPNDPDHYAYRTRRSYGPLFNDGDHVPLDDPNGGRAKIKIVLTRTDGTFAAAFDLMQIVGTGVTLSPSDTSEATAQGADFDSSGTVNSNDLASFGTAYLGQWPAADLNGDGSIDARDLTIYMTRYSR